MNIHIQTPTPELNASVSFYEKLHFSRLQEKNKILFSDGSAIIEVNPDRYARAGIKLTRDSWSDLLPSLKKISAVTRIDGGFLTSDPSGTWIYLTESAEAPQLTADESTFSILGHFAGISIETTDMQKSIKLWSLLGFNQNSGSMEDGWSSLTDENGFMLSFMKPLSCPHLFFNPSLTYFNGENNLAVIEKIRASEVPISEEITYFNKDNVVDNIIIRDPGGLGFFIFND